MAKLFNSSKSVRDTEVFSYEFIKSSYSFFSLIIFCEIDLFLPEITF